jgi:uracil-DNA glycosylase
VPTEVGITRMRGRRIDWWLGATLIPTFHPAAALRGRPQVKADMEEDFALVAEVLKDGHASAEQAEPVQSTLGHT